MGIAVARFDRRGDDVPLDDQVEDAMKVVAELHGRPEIDGGRIGLWGFSQGAWVAPLAASRSSEIAFLVLVASAGVSPATQMLYGTAKHARMAGFGDDVAARLVNARTQVDEWRRGHVSIEAAQEAVDAIADEAWFAHSYLRRSLREIGFWPDLDFDPAPVFARVRVPVLLFYGEDDEWVPIDASIEAWRWAATQTKNRDVTIVRLPGAGHAPTLGGAASIEAISPDYERAMLPWLARITRAG
jgi:pimeloyl-ACP methyl ester carboxylesterase